MLSYVTWCLIAQAFLLSSVFDKFNYFCAIPFYVLFGWAVHYHMPWPWQLSTVGLALLCEASLYSIDIWEEVANPFKRLKPLSACVAAVIITFCFIFLYYLNIEQVHISPLFGQRTFFLWLFIIYMCISCIWTAFSITDYLAPKVRSVAKLKITKIYAQKMSRGSTTNYLEVSIDGIDRKFVITSVAYSVLKDKKEVTVNLWQGFSGALFVKNDFLREERWLWRKQVLTNMLVLLLIILLVYGLISLWASGRH